MLQAVNQFFLSLLNFFASNLGGNYGLAIIALTLAIRLILLPLIIPSIKSQKKLAELKPELDKLKSKHADDKQALAQKQLELYKLHSINPASGCLPQVVQIALFIAFYRVLITSLNNGGTGDFSLSFLWLTLNQPDSTFVLPIAAGLSQFILGVMLLPGASTKAEQQLAAQTKTKTDDKKAADMTEMAKTMQSQMIFIMPFLTFFIALRFPSGLALYWVVSTFFSIAQQYFVSGPGGLVPQLAKLRKFTQPKN